MFSAILIGFIGACSIFFIHAPENWKKNPYGLVLTGIGFYVGFVWTDLQALVINLYRPSYLSSSPTMG